MRINAIIAGRGAVVTVGVGAHVRDALALLHTRRIGAVLVMDNDEIAGVLSERDIVRGLHTVGASVVDEPVTRCMTAPVVTVTPADSLDHALALMTERRFRHLPVVDGGLLVGLVSIGDLVKHRIEAVEREAAELKGYIASG